MITAMGTLFFGIGLAVVILTIAIDYAITNEGDDL